jgi:hypothetical protein
MEHKTKKCTMVIRKRLKQMYCCIERFIDMDEIYFTLFILLEFISLLCYCALPYYFLTKYSSIQSFCALLIKLMVLS